MQCFSTITSKYLDPRRWKLKNITGYADDGNKSVVKFPSCDVWEVGVSFHLPVAPKGMSYQAMSCYIEI